MHVAAENKNYCGWILRASEDSKRLPRDLHAFSKYLRKHHGGVLCIGKFKNRHTYFDQVVREDQGYCDWVLSLDADERVSPELATEITTLLRQDPAHRGYRIPRTTQYLGRWIRTTDWYPDRQLRLYDRRVAQWSLDRVHESVRVDASVGRLQHELRHHSYRDLSDHLARIDRYTTLVAARLLDEGRRAGPLDLVVHPPAAFLRNYLIRRGCLQGVPGLIVSLMNAYYVFLKHAKLWELRHERRRAPDERG